MLAPKRRPDGQERPSARAGGRSRRAITSPLPGFRRLPSSPRLMCRAGAAAAESGRCGPAAGRATPILHLHWCRSYSAPPAIGRNRSGRHQRLEPSRLTCIGRQPQVVRNGPVAPGLSDLGMPESAPCPLIAAGSCERAGGSRGAQRPRGGKATKSRLPALCQGIAGACHQPLCPDSSGSAGRQRSILAVITPDLPVLTSE